MGSSPSTAEGRGPLPGLPRCSACEHVEIKRTRTARTHFKGHEYDCDPDGWADGFVDDQARCCCGAPVRVRVDASIDFELETGGAVGLAPSQLPALLCAECRSELPESAEGVHSIRGGLVCSRPCALRRQDRPRLGDV